MALRPVPKCGHRSSDARLTETTCRQLGCRGRYAPSALGNGEFYRQLYLTADIERILAQEHTGLLSRPVREQVEKDFKQGRINLLSATPTLEMGIDIGDLSSVLLCSVPPAQANYVQRVGRAGRRTGNALATTVAGGRPHDLYFWANPQEMLAGIVDTPGRVPECVRGARAAAHRVHARLLGAGARREGEGAWQAERCTVRGPQPDAEQVSVPVAHLRRPAPGVTCWQSSSRLFGSGQEGLSSEDSRTYLENFIDGGGGEGTLPGRSSTGCTA